MGGSDPSVEAQRAGYRSAIEKVKTIARNPVVRAVTAGAVIGGVVGPMVPLPTNPSATEAQEPSRITTAMSSPTLSETTVVSTRTGKVEITLPTASPTPTPEPTKPGIYGATAAKETPPAKIEIFNQNGELSYTSFFYFGDKLKPAEKDTAIKEMLDKTTTISIDRSDVYAHQPSKGNELFVVGPDGTKYASVSLSDGDPILLTQEQYADFLNKGWVGGHTGRTDRYSDHLSFWLMKGSKIQVEVKNLPRPDGTTRPVIVFKGITVPEVDPARPTDFMTKEGSISYDKFFNVKGISYSILDEMLNEMAGKDISILFDKYSQYGRPTVYSSSPENDFTASDGKTYKAISLWTGNTTVRLLLTPQQYESFKQSGWNLGSREEHKGSPATAEFPAERPYLTEVLPLDSTIKGRISGDTDETGKAYLIFQGIDIPSAPAATPGT